MDKTAKYLLNDYQRLLESIDIKSALARKDYALYTYSCLHFIQFPLFDFPSTKTVFFIFYITLYHTFYRCFHCQKQMLCLLSKYAKQSLFYWKCSLRNQQQSPSEHSQRSTMTFFVKIGSAFQLLTFFTQRLHQRCLTGF